jgi:hypothetical protein
MEKSGYLSIYGLNIVCCSLVTSVAVLEPLT